MEKKIKPEEYIEEYFEWEHDENNPHVTISDNGLKYGVLKVSHQNVFGTKVFTPGGKYS